MRLLSPLFTICLLQFSCQPSEAAREESVSKNNTPKPKRELLKIEVLPRINRENWSLSVDAEANKYVMQLGENEFHFDRIDLIDHALTTDSCTTTYLLRGQKFNALVELFHKHSDKSADQSIDAKIIIDYPGQDAVYKGEAQFFNDIHPLIQSYHEQK